MSYSRFDARDEANAGRLKLSGVWRVAGLVVWAVINAGLLFAEQLAELLAPILMLGGAIWWAIPRGLDSLKLDGTASDILQQFREHVPVEFVFGGSYYSATVLVVDGLWCLAVVAICRTLSSLLATLLLDRP